MDSLKRIETALAGHMDEFDAVLVTGLSGVVPGAIFCHAYEKQLVVLRKELRDKDGNLIAYERTHGVILEGSLIGPGLTVMPYIVLDDFAARGDTLFRLLDVYPESPPKYIVLYNQSCGTAYTRWGNITEMMKHEGELILHKHGTGENLFRSERKPCAST